MVKGRQRQRWKRQTPEAYSSPATPAPDTPAPLTPCAVGPISQNKRVAARSRSSCQRARHNLVRSVHFFIQARCLAARGRPQLISKNPGYWECSSCCVNVRKTDDILNFGDPLKPYSPPALPSQQQPCRSTAF
jgi:hypothetical protein